MRPPSSRTLFELLLEQAERFPDRPAVICGERTASYRELAAGAACIAEALAARGIGRGDRVGILINNRHEWLECCFAATALGAIAVPFSTVAIDRRDDRLENTESLSNARLTMRAVSALAVKSPPRSAPEENALSPTPVTTTQRQSEVSSRSQSAAKSPSIARVMALRLGWLSIVTTTM